MPIDKSVLHRAFQIESESLHLPVVMINQRLNVSLEVCPAPLESFGLPVHFRTVAVDDSPKFVPEKFGQRRCCPAREDGKYGEVRSDCAGLAPTKSFAQ